MFRFTAGALAALVCLTAPLAAQTRLTDAQALGQRIFEDANLSEPRGMSCMSCHDPRRAFQGNNGSRIAAVAAGSRPDHFGTRKVPTLMYKAYSPPFGFYKDLDDGKETLEAKGGQFWDGRADDLAQQALGPLVNPDEMNNPSLEAAAAKIAAGDYADLAKSVYGADLFDDPKAAMAKLAGAVAAFEQSERFAPFSSRFDDWLRGKARFSALESRGYRVFVDRKRGNCIACHTGRTDSKDPTDWLFTDFTYDAFGVPRNPAIPANADPQHFDLGLCARPGLAAVLPKEVARDSLCGAFKVPTLRNVAVSAPYFHNGAVVSLRDAVAIYATRDTDPAHWYPRAGGGVNKFDDLPAHLRAGLNTTEVPYDRKIGQRPRLDNGDIEALVAFLRTLTDKGME
ncbi:MAG: c-type cytochrome [Pseudomonadota bacterium]|nr:c-type cytochrome [Pseudomonadota bacterium]